MQITEEQKQQLIDLNDSRVNEILNFVLKVGYWYFNGNGKTLFCYNNTRNKRYGFNSEGKWSEGIGNACDDRLTKATKQEIEQALISEAKRRGFKEGVKFKNMYSHEPKTLKGILVYIDKQNKLMVKDGFCNDYDIFVKGQWAEIIDEKAELKQEIKELREKLKELEGKL